MVLSAVYILPSHSFSLILGSICVHGISEQSEQHNKCFSVFIEVTTHLIITLVWLLAHQLYNHIALLSTICFFIASLYWLLTYDHVLVFLSTWPFLSLRLCNNNEQIWVRYPQPTWRHVQPIQQQLHQQVIKHTNHRNTFSLGILLVLLTIEELDCLKESVHVPMDWYFCSNHNHWDGPSLG